MKSLAENFVYLSGLRYWMSPEESAAVPVGRLAALEDFGSNPGELGAHYHIPASCPPRAPLVVVLHGCTQSAAAYDHHAGWSQLADEASFAVLYPEQQQANNPNLCFNWFQPGDIRRDGGEAHSIRQMIEALIVRHDLDSDRIFITGLSAGGAMTAVMLATYPELFASGAVIAGLAYGGANTMFEALDCMRGSRASSDADLLGLVQSASSHGGPWPSITIWQGAADHTVAPSNADHISAQWRGIHDLGAVPDRSETLGIRVRQSWCDEKGNTLVEVNTLQDMGHGAPVGDDLGSAGPYMLAVGVSSTREIAQFWQIS